MRRLGPLRPVPFQFMFSDLGTRWNGPRRAKTVLEISRGAPTWVMQDFKHIKAWQRAHALAISIDKLTRAFTRAGYGHLRSQLNKAADSISETIVEGCGADSNREFARFLDMAIKSANETEGRLLKAKDFGLISHDDWERYSGETIEIRKMTFGYRAKVLKSARAEKKRTRQPQSRDTAASKRPELRSEERA